jgi:DNA repair exonuclease SbcCD ATPase subunit
MAYYDEQLQLFQQKVAQKKREESKLKDLYRQRKELHAKVNELQECELDEQADVDRLEGRSLSAFFYAVIGRKVEKLGQEREEAYAAKVKCDVAARELSAVEEDIRRGEAELEQLHGCEQQFEALLREKSEAIKSSGTKEGTEIFKTEEHIAHLESQTTEIHEALRAGRTALDITESILDSLGSAENWGTFDLLGGGLVSDIVKHSHLDEAQELVEQLQIQLRRFKTELTDVTIHADMQISIDGFLGFADYFFDGLFTDWTVLDQIKDSQRQVQDTRSQIESVLSRLTSMLAATESELACDKTRLDDLIVTATI